MALHTLLHIVSDGLFTEAQHNAAFVQHTEGVFAPDIFYQSSDDSESRDDRDQTPCEPPIYAFLQITSSPEHRPRQPGRGWILGRSLDCDIIIGGKDDGVSRQQFEIVPQREPGLFVVSNLSRNGTQMKAFSEKGYTTVRSKRGLSYDTNALAILVNRVTMDLSAAKVGTASFKKAWGELLAWSSDHGPALSSLMIAPPPSSTHVSRHILKGAFDTNSQYRIFVAEKRGTKQKVLLKRFQGGDASEKAAREVEVHSKLKHVSSPFMPATPC